MEKLTSQRGGNFEENQNIEITFLDPININIQCANLVQGQAK